MNRETLTTTHTDIRALEMVDEAYADRTGWIKKSIRTTAKVGSADTLPSTRVIMELIL